MSITIKIKENGPYLIPLEDAASVVIVNAAGERIEPAPGKAIALCRCGHSGRKPFCDGTHRTIEFQGALAAPAVLAALAASTAPPTSAVTALPPAPVVAAAPAAPAVAAAPPVPS